MNTLQSLLCEAITGNTGSFFDKIKLDITCNLCVIKEPWREGGVGGVILALVKYKEVTGVFKWRENWRVFFFFLSSDLLKASVAAKEKSHRGRDRSQVLDLQPN